MITVLSALTNPATQAAGFALLEIVISGLRLVERLDQPEMTEQEKMAEWLKIKAMINHADAILESALKSHPNWPSNGDQTPDA